MRTVFIGRWQPFHDGHRALIQSAVDQGNEIIIGIRDTEISPENPYPLFQRWMMIREEFPRAQVFVIPDFDEIAYGRKVGYSFREISLDTETETISGTKIREQEVTNEVSQV